MKVLGRRSIASRMEVALGILWWILWAGLALIGVLALCYAVTAGLVVAGVLPHSVLEGPRYHVNIGGSDLSFESDDGLAWQVVLPALIAAAAAISGSLIIVNRLRRLFESFRSAEPFRKENATHLRVIWIAMIAMELTRYGALMLAGVLIAAFGQPPNLRGDIHLHINLMTWASIFVLIVLAEVFREGTRLREEQDLTI